MKKTMKSVLLASGLTLAAIAPAEAQGFEGAYAGIYAGTSFSFVGWMGGVQAGYNFAFAGDAIAGVEGDVFVTNGGQVWGTAAGRLGYALSPEMMLFASLGAGTNGANTYYQIGGGGEFNVTDQVYLRADLDRLRQFSGGVPIYYGKIGAGYRF